MGHPVDEGAKVTKHQHLHFTVIECTKVYIKPYVYSKYTLIYTLNYAIIMYLGTSQYFIGST